MNGRGNCEFNLKLLKTLNHTLKYDLAALVHDVFPVAWKFLEFTVFPRSFFVKCLYVTIDFSLWVCPSYDERSVPLHRDLWTLRYRAEGSCISEVREGICK